MLLVCRERPPWQASALAADLGRLPALVAEAILEAEPRMRLPCWLTQLFLPSQVTSSPQAGVKSEGCGLPEGCIQGEQRCASVPAPSCSWLGVLAAEAERLATCAGGARSDGGPVRPQRPAAPVREARPGRGRGSASSEPPAAVAGRGAAWLWMLPASTAQAACGAPALAREASPCTCRCLTPRGSATWEPGSQRSSWRPCRVSWRQQTARSPPGTCSSCPPACRPTRRRRPRCRPACAAQRPDAAWLQARSWHDARDAYQTRQPSPGWPCTGAPGQSRHEPIAAALRILLLVQQRLASAQRPPHTPAAAASRAEPAAGNLGCPGGTCSSGPTAGLPRRGAWAGQAPGRGLREPARPAGGVEA